MSRTQREKSQGKNQDEYSYNRRKHRFLRGDLVRMGEGKRKRQFIQDEFIDVPGDVKVFIK